MFWRKALSSYLKVIVATEVIGGIFISIIIEKYMDGSSNTVLVVLIAIAVMVLSIILSNGALGIAVEIAENLEKNVQQNDEIISYLSELNEMQSTSGSAGNGKTKQSSGQTATHSKVSINGISYSMSTKTLDLSDSSVTDDDFTKICKLTALTQLNLSGNYISDISPIKSLKKLKQLLLADNNIEDISPLTDLINLEYLDLQSNGICDTYALLELEKLKELYISENYIGEDQLDDLHNALPECEIEV